MILYLPNGAGVLTRCMDRAHDGYMRNTDINLRAELQTLVDGASYAKRSNVKVVRVSALADLLDRSENLRALVDHNASHSNGVKVIRASYLVDFLNEVSA